MRGLETLLKARIAELHTAAGANPPAPSGQPGYRLSNLHGIEVDEFAVLITRITLWMGHKLATDLYGLVEPVLPLTDLSNIVQGDALKAPWPEVGAIIGNPPFHGTKMMRSELGDEYIDWLNAEFECGVKDYVVYWFRRAADHLKAGQHAGFVATNSIREHLNKEAALQYVTDRGGVITNAVSSQRWPGDANVHVSLVNWVQDPETPPATYVLDGAKVDGITADLRSGPELPRPQPLTPNARKQFAGVVPSGDGFILTESEAEVLLARTDADYRHVVQRYLVGDDIANDPRQEPTRWIINFAEMPLEQAEQWPAALQIVRDRVKPKRDPHAKKREREQWWKFSRTVQPTFTAIAGLDRYLVNATTAKWTPWAWCDNSWCPSNLTNVFPFDDDYTFGILTSSIHRVWGLREGSSLETRPRYIAQSFKTFPFPDPVDDTARSNIGDLAAKIVDLRSQICIGSGIGLTTLYNQMAEGAHAPLADLQDAIDVAVVVAYGWPKVTANDPNDIQARLAHLNADIVGGIRPYQPFPTAQPDVSTLDFG